MATNKKKNKKKDKDQAAEPKASDKKEGELSDEELGKVAGGVRDAASGLPTGKRQHLPLF